TTISGCIRLLMALSLSFCTLSTVCGFVSTVEELEQGFQNPGENARAWVYWLWINGNITKEGITADLESFKRIGIGGVIWMEVSGPWWAPDGEVEPRRKKGLM
ncbi:MAG: glycosyl hydrolase, partial [Planctomycetota bacterium]